MTVLRFDTDARGERSAPTEPHGLYLHWLAAFNRAVEGRGSPAATGEDGVRSLTAALAVLEAARGSACLSSSPGALRA